MAADAYAFDPSHQPVRIAIGAGVSALELRDGLFAGAGGIDEGLKRAAPSAATDGSAPAASRPTTTTRSRCSTLLASKTSRSSPRRVLPLRRHARPINPALIGHAERARAYRIAVLDTPPNSSPARRARAQEPDRFDTYAALYYPWVTVANPLAAARPRRHPTRDRRCRRPASSAASTRATTSSAASTRRRPTRSCAARSRFERDVNIGAAGSAQPARRQLPPLLRRPRLSASGARARSAPTPSGSTSTCGATSSTSSIDRPRHAVGGVRAQRRAPVGQRPRHRRGLPLQRMASAARCSATSRRRRSSCAATARP